MVWELHSRIAQVQECNRLRREPTAIEIFRIRENSRAMHDSWQNIRGRL
jgi:hypothetical protein